MNEAAPNREVVLGSNRESDLPTETEAAAVVGLSPKMRDALQEACGGVGLYHEFRNTSTVNALVKRGLIRSDGGSGWYRATDAGRATLAKATTASSVGTDDRNAGGSEAQ